MVAAAGHPAIGKASRTVRMLGASFALLLVVSTPAASAQGDTRMHGTVVSVDRSATTLQIHHGPFAGMPAMTMPFRLDAATLVRAHPGNAIEGDVETRTSPWTLHATHLASGTTKVRLPQESAMRLLAIGDSLPPALLVNQLGRAFALNDAHGAPTLVTFFYSRCRDATMCPLISAKFRQLQDAHSPARLVEITLDPAFDRPAVLRRYGQAFGAEPARWKLATGPPKVLAALADSLGISSNPAVAGTIAHTESLSLFDAGGRLVAVINGTQWTVEDVLALIRASGESTALATVREAIRSSLVVLCGTRTAEVIVETFVRWSLFGGALLLVVLVAGWGIVLARREG